MASPTFSFTRATKADLRALASRIRFVRAHPDMARIRKHSQVQPATLCRIWTGSKTLAGYGQVNCSGRGSVLAHRRAYELHHGPIPAGYDVDHLCRNTGCVMPWHLEAVPPAENRRRQGAAVTHCPAGHPYSPENTYRAPSAPRQRRCRECARRRQRAKEA